MEETRVEEINTEEKLPGMDELFKEAWQIYKNKFAVLAGVYVLGWIAAFIVTEAGTYVDEKGSLIAGMLLAMVSVVIMIWATAATMVAVVKKGETSLQEAYQRGGEVLASFTWVGVLSGLVALGGYVLFVIPGIVISIYTMASSYLVVIGEKKGLEALVVSKKYIEGRWWQVAIKFIGGLAVFVLTGLVIMLILTVPIRLGGLDKALVEMVIDLVSVAMAPFFMLYVWLLVEKLKKRPINEEKLYKKWWIVGVLWGVVAAMILGLFLFFGYYITENMTNEELEVLINKWIEKGRLERSLDEAERQMLLEGLKDL